MDVGPPKKPPDYTPMFWLELEERTHITDERYRLTLAWMCWFEIGYAKEGCWCDERRRTTV